MGGDHPESLGNAEHGNSVTDGWNARVSSREKGTSAVDGKSAIFFDRKWARNEYKNLSPEARREVDNNVNNIFALRNIEFVSGKKLKASNPEHKPYFEQKTKIRDELMTWSKDGKTGREYWEAEAARDKQFRKQSKGDTENISRQVDRDLKKATTEASVKSRAAGAEVDVAKSPGEAAAAPRHKRIWPEERALTGKLFKEHVVTETTIYGHGASKRAAFRIAEKLTPDDLDSEAMRTPEGEKGLGILREAMLQTGEYYRPRFFVDMDEKRPEAEQKQIDRIHEAWLKVRQALRGDKVTVEKTETIPTKFEINRENFGRNFPEFTKEVKKKIEKDKSIKVEKIYHRPFMGKYEEVRAVLFKKTWINNPSAPSGTIETKHDVCLGGIDLSGKGESISGSKIEKHGSAAYSFFQLDDILLVGTVAKATGKLFYKGVTKGIEKVSSKLGISSASAIGKELGEEIAERGIRGVDALASTQRIARIGEESGADALTKTQRIARIEKPDSSVDALAKTERVERASISDPGAAFNEAATSQRVARTASEDTPLNSSARIEGTETHTWEPPADRHDTIPDVARTWEPPFKGADTIPDRAPAGDAPSGPRDTIRGQGRTLDDRSPVAGRSSSDGSPGGIPLQSENLSWAGKPADHGYDRYLGRPLYAAARDFGMGKDDLLHYVDGQLWRKASRENMYNPAGVRDKIQRTVVEQLSRLEALEAKAEIRRAVQHGDNPDSLLRLVDDLESKGLTGDQVRSHLRNRNNLLDCAKQDLVGQDLKWHLRTNAGPYSAVKSAYVQKERTAFLEADALKPDSIKDGWPGPEKMQRWYKEADVYADRLWNRFMSRP
jgi:hypothetical protein